MGCGASLIVVYVSEDRQSHQLGSVNPRSHFVYVLRDMRSDAVLFVGVGSEGGRAGGGAPTLDTELERHSGLGPSADVVLVVVAENLIDEATATIVQNAVSQVSQPASADVGTNRAFSPGFRRLGVAGPSDGEAGGDDAKTLDAIEIERLGRLLLDTRVELKDVTASTFLDREHRKRLETLILDQDAAIGNLDAALERVRALCKLAEWADRSTAAPGGATVRVDDVKRALDDSGHRT